MTDTSRIAKVLCRPRAFREVFLALVQESEHSDSIRRSYVNLPIDYHGRYEFVSDTELVSPTGCFITVVQLGRQIFGVVGVQNRGGCVLRDPENGVAIAVRRNAGSCPWIGESVGGLGCGSAYKLRCTDAKSLDAIPDRSVVDRVVEECRHGEYAARPRAF